MKKNIFSFTSAAVLLLAVGLVGCSRENVNDEKETRTIFLKVALSETRAETTPIGPTQQATFTVPGKLFFTTSSGTIVRQLTIDATGYVSGVTDDDVTLTELTTGGGIQIVDVPASAARVYVFGTLQSGFPAVISGTTNISVCLEAALAVAQLFNAGDVTKIPAYGSGPIMPKAGGDYEAFVPVAPAAGRIEIAQISGSSDFASFKVAGVYVNKYYNQLGINGKVLPGTTLEDNLSVPGNYVSTGGTYNNTAAGMLYNEPASAYTSVSNVVKDFGSANNVLAYNLLPVNTAGYFPHLVIKLTDIVLDPTDGVTFAGTWFLTITGVAMAATPADHLDFLAGNVYRIADLAFTPGDLTKEPELATRDVTVEVEVLNWQIVNVNPTFD
jgi:hypothetical protein